MKAIIFDFDGTLTYKSRNVWKAIWQDLGYDTGKTSYFAQIYMEFMRKEITHQDWCDKTCEKLLDKAMGIEELKAVASEIKLINGFEETIKALHDEGYSLNIVSGCVGGVIRAVIGKENLKYFDTISANKMIFDEGGYLEDIIGTKYDFEGKALFIDDFKQKTGCESKDILFIGNGHNDEWAYLSGCRTLCINPEDTCSANRSVWHKAVDNMTDLKEILPFILGREQA